MRNASRLSKIVWLWFGLSIAVPLCADESGALPGTKPLTRDGDIASQLVEGVDRFLLQELDKSIAARAKFWQRDFSSADAYYKSIEPNRKHLAHILGVRDPRVPFDGPEYVGTASQPALVGEAERYQIFSVRWPAFGNVTGEGLMLVPKSGPIKANMVVIPDADQTPEAICGLIEGPGPTLARNLAEQGCRVIVPVLIDRSLKPRAPPGRQGGARLTNREYLYRSAFELGRHLIGYEVQKVLACVDWFYREANQSESGSKDPQIGVLGYGEGGMLALYSAAIDTRIDSCGVHGYFGSRQRIWDEPIDRNVFGLLERYGDAELASMVFPRRVVITGNDGPIVNLPSEGGAPAKLAPITAEDSAAEWKRYQSLVNTRLEPNEQSKKLATLLQDAVKPQGKAPTFLRKGFDPATRQLRQLQEMDLFTQQLLNESQYVRQDFMGKLNTSNLDEYRKSVEQYREIFRHQVIGHFPNPVLPMNPASRKADETNKWTAYEVTLDVFPDVFAYGILLLPNNIRPGERRPVVVCQHGLEGRPSDVCDPDKITPYYNSFGASLADRGYIVFAPQNCYIGKADFRLLQRKANPIKLSLFSYIVRRHERIIDWLETLPMVDGKRIGFYGLSYGGKTAMRVPALVPRYALSICSGDFNEWVGKNILTDYPGSYVFTFEHEMPEFDLGHTFNYAEMAFLIAPRPFMVERGHDDGVGIDEMVSWEFARVRRQYSRLNIPEKTEITYFPGGHEVRGGPCFDFLDRHLQFKPR